MAKFDLKNKKLGSIKLVYIRDFFKTLGISGTFHIQKIMHYLGLTNEHDTNRLMQALIKEGLIEYYTDNTTFSITMKGQSLAMATMQKRASKEKIDAIKNEVLCRATHIYKSTDFKVKIKKIVLFGSAIKEQKDYGDIDLFIEYSFEEDCKLHQQNSEMNKAIKFLKARNRYISLHSIHEMPLIEGEKLVIFTDKDLIRSACQDAIKKGYDALITKERPKKKKVSKCFSIHLYTDVPTDDILFPEPIQYNALSISNDEENVIWIIYEAYTYRSKDNGFVVSMQNSLFPKKDRDSSHQEITKLVKQKIKPLNLRDEILSWIDDAFEELDEE